MMAQEYDKLSLKQKERVDWIIEQILTDPKRLHKHNNNGFLKDVCAKYGISFSPAWRLIQIAFKELAKQSRENRPELIAKAVTERESVIQRAREMGTVAALKIELQALKERDIILGIYSEQANLNIKGDVLKVVFDNPEASVNESDSSPKI